MRRDPADHALARPRPLHPLGGPQLADPVRAALPRRLRPRARRPEGAAHLGLARPPATRSTGTPTASRSPPARSARASSSAVGFAYAARYERGLFDPDAAAGTSPFDHFIYVIAGDGDLQEGVTSEASSLAGHQQLGNLVVDLRLQPDLDRGRHQHRLHRRRRARATRRTAGTCRPSTGRRPASTSRTSPSCTRAIEAAKGETDKPSIIILKTIIGWPSPGKQNTGKIHGSALGADELAATKEVLGFDPEQTFVVADDVLEHTRGAARARRGRSTPSGRRRFDAWAAANPEKQGAARPPRGRRAARRRRVRAARLRGRQGGLDPRRVRQGHQRPRRACCPSSGAVRPTSPSRTSRPSTARRRSSRPSGRPTSVAATPTAACCTSASASTRWARSSTASCCTATTRAFGGTFLIFSDYMRPAVRLAALMKVPSIFVWTHDSVALGEDGPTHQPIEQLATLRAIPGSHVVRPADANEVAYAWLEILERTDGPAGHRADPPEHPGVRARRRRGLR